MKFAFTPKAHQLAEFELSRDHEHRGLFWEMGTGKTKPSIDTAAWLYVAGEIDAVIVLAPNGVHRNWVVDELPDHMSPDVVEKMSVLHWMTSRAKNKGAQLAAGEFMKYKDGLKIVCMSYDGIMTEPGAKFLSALAKTHRCMGVLDESPYIKTPGSKRTKRILAMGKHLPYRRILTGTIVDDKPFDVFTQIKFLDPEAWDDIGCRTFSAFKATFGVWRTGMNNGREFPMLVNFRNLPLLGTKVAQYGSRLLKKDVLDLPEKLYTKRYFAMTPEQWKHYRSLRDQMMTWFEGEFIAADLAITARLRLQQVTSGYLPTDDPDSDDVVMTPIMEASKNPRLKALLEVIEEAGDQQIIVWAKYRNDIDQILSLLSDVGISAVRYDGQCSETQAGESVDAFKAGDAKVFVGNAAKGAEGITLTCATVVVYYNNSYKLSKRLQSEDRAHRIGQTNHVLYVDLCATDTVDDDIIDALRRKYEMAAVVQGDELRNWI